IDGLRQSEANPDVLRVLSEARKMIDQELARAAPGIKALDRRYSDLARQKEALSRGATLLDSGRGATRPVELAEMLQKATPGERLRLQQGARGEIDRLVGTTANDLTALKRTVKGEGDWNRDRLVMLFGKKKADQIFRAVDREAAFDEAYRNI